jgi:enoyl-CoA hydratase
MGEQQYSFIKVTREGAVTTIQLNRPEVLNALNLKLMDEVISALGELEEDPETRCVVITGNERAFAAGADIKEMADASAVDMLVRDQFAKWDRIRRFKKPLIAAVSGYALGGGSELAMMCDMIVASETAQFGQPEINLGVIPGAGGTQRMTRAVGKAVAMEVVLAGRTLSAKEALQHGLVNRVVPVEAYLQEAQRLAARIAEKSPIALQLAKEAVLKVYDTALQEGLLFERKNFYLLFGTEDQKEGMAAFVEKRKPQFRGK